MNALLIELNGTREHRKNCTLLCTLLGFAFKLHTSYDFFQQQVFYFDIFALQL